MPNDGLPKQSYKLQKHWAETDTECWAQNIRALRCGTGFGEEWINQGVGQAEVFLKNFKTGLLDIDI